MEYGCIGEHLGHSFSKEIHALLAPYGYELLELAPSDVDAFMREKNFKAINVTIPYKETVLPYLSPADDGAKTIGAVNTVVNRGGKLFGYNTDFYGMISLIRHARIEVKGAKVAVLGTGGTSKTAVAVSKYLGASCVRSISRSGKDGALTYDELYSSFSDAEIIINTTPVGMYPENDGLPVELDRLPCVRGVIDAVYNPLRTRLVTEAAKRGIRSEGGLYMLTAQGVRASEIFLGTKYGDDTCEAVYKKILASKENIVLTGMPGCGKSTVGKLLSESTGRPLFDTDEEIIKLSGKPIKAIFSEEGEKAFRNLESKVIKEISKKSGVIIATGGGAVMRAENIDALCGNGKIFFIDRQVSELVPTEDRPLAADIQSIEKIYKERYETYLRTADIRIEASGNTVQTANEIRKCNEI